MAGQDLGFRSLQTLIRSRLRESILQGRYAPGQKLNINVLAKTFSVSPVPLREALRALEAEGFVEFSPNRGAVVKSFSTEEVREAFLIRIPLERMAVREAIPKLKAADFAFLERILDRMESVSDQGRWLELNRAFHLGLYERAALPRLQQISILLWAVVSPYLRVFLSHQTDRTKDHREHRALLDACRRKDLEAAERIIEQHLLDTRDVILTAFADGSLASPWSEPSNVPAARDGRPRRGQLGRSQIGTAPPAQRGRA